MNIRTLIKIGILLFLFDRVEFLYYAFEGSDQKVGFVFKGDPIRIDSYVYFASIGLQQVIFATVIYLLIPLKSSKFFLIACVLCFFEYFLTYGQPIAKIPLPGEFYIPVSASTLRFMSVCYFMYECVKKAFNGNDK